jgi:ribosomal protein S18 acetylase RimI-like enzyme
MIKEVQEIAFKDNPNYYPSTEKEFDLIAQSMIQISKPGMIKLIMHEDNVAGFVISYPDISKALRDVKGKLFPLGWIKVLKEKNNTEIVNFNGVGILPKYQGLGANVLLYVELEKTIRSHNYKYAEFVQVNEDNFKSKSDWETLGVSMTKTHRTYRLNI